MYMYMCMYYTHIFIHTCQTYATPARVCVHACAYVPVQAYDGCLDALLDEGRERGLREGLEQSY